MTTRPRLIELDRRLLLGILPLGLFVAIAALVITTDFSGVVVSGLDGGGLEVVEGMAYSFIGAPELSSFGTEDFLVALVLIAVLLDAALDGALMLAKRDDGGEQ